jgi:hypothetical protein
MDLCSVGPVTGGPEALERQAREVAQTLTQRTGEAPKLAIIYLPYRADHSAYLKALRRAVGCPIMGATTGGCAFTERGFSEDGAVVALIGGEVDVRCEVARGVSVTAMGALEAALKGLPKPLGKHQVVFTLADPFSTDGEALAKTLRKHTQVSCQHLGGTAGDNWQFEQPLVFYGEEALSSAVVIASLYTDAPMVGSVRHGFCPVQQRPITITKSEDNVLLTLDGRPALTVYKEVLQQIGALRADAPMGEVLSKLATYSIGMRSIFSDELKVRTPMGADAEKGSIQLAGSVLEGSSVFILDSTPDKLIEAVSEVAAAVHGGLTESGRQPRGALAIDCAGRYRMLGARFSEEVAALSDDGHVPVVGFASYGELARLQGRVEGFHNTTVVLMGW